jgi:group I intron endonuclease
MGCIYVIENIVNGKKYVGQSVTGKKRIQAHLSTLKNNKHINTYLQRAFNKYGEAAFTFKILVDDLPERYMDDVERGLIATFRAADREHGYNLESGGHENKRLSSETKEKMSASHKGKRKSPESIEKRSQSILKLRRDPNYVHPNIGKKLSAKTKEKISNSHKGKKVSPKTIENNRQAKLKWFADGNTHPMQRRIIDSEGTIWPSITSFCKVYDAHMGNIVLRHLKTGKPYKGLYLKYYDTKTKNKEEV